MTEPDNTNSTPDTGETSLQKRDTAQMVTYAKWGLMGVGAIALVNIVTGLLFNPLALGLVAVGGGFAWWKFKGSKRSDDGGETIVPAAPPRSEPVPAARPPVVAPPPGPQPVGLAPVPERGSAAPLAPPSTPSPKVPGFAADELAEFDRRLSELDSLD